MITAALIVTVAMARQAPDCAQLLASNPPPPIVQLCRAEETMRKAADLPAEAPERVQLWREAGELYARAAQVLVDPGQRTYVLDMLASLFDPAYLNDPPTVENALRQLATIAVDTPAPLLRLATFQEQHTGVDAAENTLLGSRQHHPASADVFTALSAFYGRRAQALAQSGEKAGTPPAAGGVNREEQGFRPNCQQYSFGNLGSGLAEACSAEADVRKAASAPAGSAERLQLFRGAADLYERAAASFRTAPEKIFAYESIARIYINQLNSPGEAEPALRQIIALSPGSAAPILRLAKVQEDQKSIDAAESTLQSARQQFPENVELLKALSAFYGRLARPATGGA